MLYIIIEHFKNQDPEKLERCFQLMETEERKHLDEWIVNWSDLVEFEVYPVISSREAFERISPRL